VPGTEVFRDDEIKGLPQGLGGGVAKHPLCAAVPKTDGAISISDENCVWTVLKELQQQSIHIPPLPCFVRKILACSNLRRQSTLPLAHCHSWLAPISLRVPGSLRQELAVELQLPGSPTPPLYY
jgi:hypothetical protein